MKKTLIALMAMAGAAFGADYTTETIWTLNFGTEYGESGCEWVGSPAGKGTVWDSAKTAVEGGSQSNANQRIHMAGGNYGSWDTDFEFSMSLTLGDTITASNDWPVFAEIAGSGTSLRFGPYIKNNNTVAVDSNNTLTKGDNNLVSVAPGGTYTITLTKIGKNVTVSVNGVASGYGTLADSVSGNITDIALGGNTGTNYRINEVVHSISWSKVTPTPAVPEPTTATLSLLALAGLAARRRRK